MMNNAVLLKILTSVLVITVIKPQNFELLTFYVSFCTMSFKTTPFSWTSFHTTKGLIKFQGFSLKFLKIKISQILFSVTKFIEHPEQTFPLNRNQWKY